MEYLPMIGQFILSLSILIVLHEMGHFFPARWFKTRVEKFYLFFNPGFSLFKKKIGETEYGLGWLPLGGYVKIAGMIDESMDTEQMKQPPQPWEFRSKPAWQRLIIMLGGVTVNFILGFIIYAGILFVWGEEYLPAKNAAYGIHADTLGMEMGLKNGDKILSIGGAPFERFNDREVVREVVIHNANYFEIERNGEKIRQDIDPRFVKELSSFKNKSKRIFLPRVPMVVGDVVKKYPAEAAGAQVGDSIIALNGQPLQFFDQFFEAVKPLKNTPITITVVRADSLIDLSMTTNEEGAVGIRPYGFDRYFQTERIEYSFLQAIPAGVSRGWGILTDQIKAFGQIISGKIAASESLGGFVSIGSMFGKTWDWERFWTMTGLLSLILGFMNLLPIPALDGGHVVFLLFEVFTGRKPSDKFVEYATMVGFFLLLALIIYANGLDIIRGCS